MARKITWRLYLFLWGYQLLWHLLLPLILLRLLIKARRLPSYSHHMGERFGLYSRQVETGKPIWIHAVSVGETRAAQPLIDELLLAGHTILLTHMTPTGRDTGAEIFAQAIQKGQLIQRYLPYDVCWAVEAFFKKHQPKIGLVMETEVWPMLIVTAAIKNIPLYLINARLSERSAKKFGKLAFLSRELFSQFICILAQTRRDARRYKDLGIEQVEVSGNLKFDVQAHEDQVKVATQLRQHLSVGLKVCCAASTREGEEEIILRAWRQMLAEHPSLVHTARLIIVPRHPQRFDEVFDLIQKEGFVASKKSTLTSSEALVQTINQGAIMVGDTMGEMSFYYAMTDFVVMGGSLMEYGGQNFIEACSLGRPVILGQHTFNFQQASLDAQSAHAVLRVATEADLISAMFLLCTNQAELESMGVQALDFANQHVGATRKILAALKKTLN